MDLDFQFLLVSVPSFIIRGKIRKYKNEDIIGFTHNPCKEFSEESKQVRGNLPYVGVKIIQESTQTQDEVFR